MKKQFVTYEIAKKLKELGFDEKCIGMYGSEFEFIIDESSQRYAQISKDVIQAPLWQQALKWLRDVHNIHISPSFNLGIKEYGGWNLNVTSLDDNVFVLRNKISRRYEEIYFEEEKTFFSFEETIEVGLLEALKLI